MSQQQLFPYTEKVYIEVAPQVHKLIRHNFGPQIHCPDGRSWLNRFARVSIADTPPMRPGITLQKLCIVVPLRVARKFRRSEQLHKDYRLALRSLFYRSLEMWVHGQVAYGSTKKQAVQNFLDHYDLTESEFSFESAYRHLSPKQ